MSNGKSRNSGRRNGASREASSHNGHGEAGIGEATDRPVLITGGAGFIGTNLAHRLLSMKRRVIVYDNLSRPGVDQNLAWLKSVHGNLVRHEQGDVRDLPALRRAVRNVSQVFHFAAQVAVTTSLERPIEDFEVNARGTLNLLEALRSVKTPPPLVFTSTNKVYGDLSQIGLRVQRGRYEPEDAGVRANGFSESGPLHFHSPYGCSKGAACQYVQDYARTFGLPTVVFRMSCIYGPHQFGTEDQGWVAHFLIRALQKSPLTIYGDGRQVRDILYVDDLVQAFQLAQQHMGKLRGQVFNIGGGPTNTTSLLELMELIGELQGGCPSVRFADWRPADQKYYVSDTRRFQEATGWAPTIGVRRGVESLWHWLSAHHRNGGAPGLPLTGLVRRLNGEVVHVAPASIRPKTLRAVSAPKLKVSRNGRRRQVAEPSTSR